jgi:hypothetical protein
LTVGDQQAGQGQRQPVTPGHRQQQSHPDPELERVGVMDEVGMAAEVDGVGERAWLQQGPRPPPWTARPAG